MDPRGWQDLFREIRRSEFRFARSRQSKPPPKPPAQGLRLLRRAECDGCSENPSDLRGTVYEMVLDDGAKKMYLSLCVFCLTIIQDLIARGRLAIPVGEGAYDA